MDKQISKRIKSLEEIKRLFDLAKDEKSEDLSPYYIKLALDSAKKSNTKISREFKNLYCKKCLSVFRKGNFRARFGKGRKVITCLKCSTLKRIIYK